MTFEESLNRLEEILQHLDGGKIDLETALTQYEEGIHLLKNCHEILDSARRKIEVLRGIRGEPEIVPEHFDSAEQY